MKTLHQFVAGFSHGDAISNEALMMRDLFRSWGFASEIFSETRYVLPELRKHIRDVSEYAESARADDAVLLHLSMGNRTNELFTQLPCRKAILYHNITPARFFRGLQEQTASHLEKGRAQIRGMSGAADVVMADSAFNARELADMGYRDVRVLPLILDLDRLVHKPNRKILRAYGDDAVNVLFVGRCVPNKRIEDVLSLFYFFHHYVEPKSRFIHVGSIVGTERYHALLLTYLRNLHLDTVEMPGAVPQDELNAYFQTADIFVSMSEHEGFCIPLIEAMVHDVPVMAYDAGAVSETLDGAGILFREKQFDELAELMGHTVRDRELRASVIEKQRRRLDRYRNRDLAAELRAHLEPIL